MRGISRLTRLTLGLEKPDNDVERRHAGVARGATSAAAVRGLGMLATLVTVPMTMSYLGAERYGAWMTIVSLLGWLSIADLGVGNHLTNALSSALGRGDAATARSAISTGFFVLAGVAAGVLAVGLPVWWVVPWTKVFNVRSAAAGSEAGSATAVALILFCIGLPLMVVDRVYVAAQRGAAGNAWSAVGIVASVAAILVGVRTRGGVPALVAATMGTTLVIKLANAGWLFGREHPELWPAIACVSRRGARAFVGRSAEFFLVQVAALVLFSTDNLVIAAVLGARQVAPYSVTWTLFALSNALLTLAFPYLWSAYADAMARGDANWVVRTLKLSLVGSTLAASVVLVPMIWYGRRIIELWAGSDAVPDAATVAWMAAWNLILAPAMSISCFLNAAGRTRVQAWAGLVAAPANIVASILLARRHGGAGVIAATVITYAAFVMLPTSLAALREVRRFRAVTVVGVVP